MELALHSRSGRSPTQVLTVSQNCLPGYFCGDHQNLELSQQQNVPKDSRVKPTTQRSPPSGAFHLAPISHWTSPGNLQDILGRELSLLMLTASHLTSFKR